MMKKEQIKQIKMLVNCGKIVQVKKENSSEKINLWMGNDNKFIFWRNFGQSVIKNNLKDLTWLINDLFEANRKNISFEIIKSTIA